MRNDLIPEGLTPEEREACEAIYDASILGAVERLDREWNGLKLAIFDALPYPVQRFITKLSSIERPS